MATPEVDSGPPAKEQQQEEQQQRAEEEVDKTKMEEQQDEQTEQGRGDEANDDGEDGEGRTEQPRRSIEKRPSIIPLEDDDSEGEDDGSDAEPALAFDRLPDEIIQQCVWFVGGGEVCN